MPHIQLSKNSVSNINISRISVISNTILTFGKLVCGIWMSSAAVISEGVHSGIDLIAAVIAFLSVRQSGLPADREHPFGHGRYENISGFVEGVLIFMAALLIIIEAVEKILNPSAVRQLSVGMAVMGVSAAVNILVSSLLFRVARKTESVAIEADAEHLRTDVITSLGVLGGLLMIKLTGWHILDPLIALGVAGLIISVAVRITRKSFEGLVDTKIEADEERRIIRAIEEKSGQMVWLHEIRTRKAGVDRFVDLVIYGCHNLDIEKVHQICDTIEEKIKQEINNANILIHVEPCPDVECNHKMSECRMLKNKGV
ncbi:MAG: cation diffusion facilitator family transporter [bacterium]|nr:cation diffusion facilitator family transporter [bacterium]